MSISQQEYYEECFVLYFRFNPKTDKLGMSYTEFKSTDLNIIGKTLMMNMCYIHRYRQEIPEPLPF